MGPWPPHAYRRHGSTSGRSEEVVRRAWQQARVVQTKGLPALLTLNHLAVESAVPYAALREFVSRSHPQPYRCFRVKKRLSGFRIICVPHPLLLRVQRWLACHVLSRVRPHAASYAYSPGGSPVECARQHCGCRWMIKVDVQQFFESISERQVYRVFRELSYQPLVAFEIARLCTRTSSGKRYERDRWNNGRDLSSWPTPYESFWVGHLPQGAATSPMLSNLVVRGLDERLSALADAANLVYTRYADDLVFSTDSRRFSRADAEAWVRTIYGEFQTHALRPRTAKTVIAPPGARKVVLGLLVDGDTPRLSREFRERLELHIYHLRKQGVVAHARRKGFRTISGMEAHIRGLLTYASHVDAHFAEPLIEEFDRIDWIPGEAVRRSEDAAPGT